jgi:hypothetical protein
MPYPGQLRGENGMGTVELLTALACQLALILTFVGRGAVPQSSACDERCKRGECNNLETRGE